MSWAESRYLIETWFLLRTAWLRSMPNMAIASSPSRATQSSDSFPLMGVLVSMTIGTSFFRIVKERGLPRVTGFLLTPITVLFSLGPHVLRRLIPGRE